MDFDTDAIRGAATRLKNFTEGDHARLHAAVVAIKQDLAKPIEFDAKIAAAADGTLNAFRKAAAAAEKNDTIIGDWLKQTPGLLNDFAAKQDESDTRHANKGRNINVEPPG